MDDTTRRIQAFRAMAAVAVTVEAKMRRQRRAFEQVTQAMAEFRRAWDRSHRV